ncbi:hypothetical protein B0T14DRAFT_54455 [Immersiella caudata]|uniref:Uncharacterized protein n=1 Tax=Immersiella caudata TaxID=314043 RepID=A0AA39XGB0_9PEZI|nr:hypothetical protein B0T14DRAFT_54455 [Immersiella caudata]
MAHFSALGSYIWGRSMWPSFHRLTAAVRVETCMVSSTLPIPRVPDPAWLAGREPDFRPGKPQGVSALVGADRADGTRPTKIAAHKLVLLPAKQNYINSVLPPLADYTSAIVNAIDWRGTHRPSGRPSPPRLPSPLDAAFHGPAARLTVRRSGAYASLMVMSAPARLVGKPLSRKFPDRSRHSWSPLSQGATQSMRFSFESRPVVSLG